jgi:hypothetical protein
VFSGFFAWKCRFLLVVSVLVFGFESVLECATKVNEVDAPYLQRHRSAKVEVSSTTKSRRRRHERD